MIFGFSKCKSDKDLRDVFFGNGLYSIKIPKQYIEEHNKEGTVMIYPKGSECITLRFDILSFNPENVNIELKTGYGFVVNNANEGNKQLYYVNDLAITFSESTVVDEGIKLIMKFWEIGPKDNKMIIMSATILETKQNDEKVKKLLALIPDLIKSIEPVKTD